MSLTDQWATPQWLFDQLNDIYGPFDLDVAASSGNAKCEVFFDEELDGLSEAWDSGGKVWCNPPYSDPSPWVEKAVLEAENGVTTGMLLPWDHSTKWFQKCIQRNMQAKIVEFFPFRIKFVPPLNWKGAVCGPRGSHIFVLFTPQVTRPSQMELPVGSRSDEKNPS